MMRFSRVIMVVLLLSYVIADLGYHSSSAHCSTIIEGLISKDTTWTVAGNPYIIRDDTNVEEGVTLTINPGVIIRIDADIYIRIDGTLKAIGTDNDMIVFTSNKKSPKPGDWYTIYFSDSAADAIFDENGNYVNGSIIQYCVIEYGGPGIQCTGSAPFIDRNIIRDNSCGYRAVPYAHGGGGIFIGWTDAPQGAKITNNIITHNKSSCGYGGGGIDIYAADPVIEYNYIADNESFSGGGIKVGSSSPIIRYNNIVDNICSSDGGNEIEIEGCPQSHLTIQYNNIVDSDLGAGYSVYLKYQWDDIEAQNNWWGTADASTIDDKIYDYYDDWDLGKVNYVPGLVSPSPEAPLPPPDCDFTALDTQGPVPLTVEFIDLSVGEVTSWSWNFGDGNVSSEQNPVHIYAEPGNYTLSLTIIGPGGVNMRLKTDFVVALKPGDINGDGEITPQDALCVLQKFVGICPTSCGECSGIDGDVTGDGQESPADALCILEYFVGLPSCLD